MVAHAVPSSRTSRYEHRVIRAPHTIVADAATRILPFAAPVAGDRRAVDRAMLPSPARCMQLNTNSSREIAYVAIGRWWGGEPFWFDPTLCDSDTAPPDCVKLRWSIRFSDVDATRTFATCEVSAVAMDRAGAALLEERWHTVAQLFALSMRDTLTELAEACRSATHMTFIAPPSFARMSA